jgi:hypothetical protein
VVLVNLVINGRELGQVPITYTVPEGLTYEETAACARDRIAVITKLLQEHGERLVQELPDGGRLEIMLGKNNDLSWLGQAPDTPEGI